ncbi:hypothetical protein SAMN04488118_11044 [Epibacterium ulvae]|uniref:Uncharacterized protein n=1 Tax=Epibacterium ulvae TaxID=1156985 RepID=A0A1G5R7U0_9RHOB|nr:hypothetical protein [Epibacterium ulvae]SCZ70145.1 hypothetical protein SAMN04488118_11044 [Epibacterium ulvae]
MTLRQDLINPGLLKKLGLTLSLPGAIVFVVPWTANSDIALRACLATMLGLGLWNLDQTPSVQGQPILYRISIALFQWFYFGCFMILMLDATSVQSALIQYAVSGALFGISMAFWHKGGEMPVAVEALNLPKQVAFLALCHFCAVGGLLGYSTSPSGLFPAIVVFCNLGFSAHQTWRTVEGKFYHILLYLSLSIALYIMLAEQ